MQIFRQLTEHSTEKYLTTLLGSKMDSFFDLGLTDSLILELAKDCDFLITSDSELSDWAISLNINVVDLVKNRNDRLLRKSD